MRKATNNIFTKNSELFEVATSYPWKVAPLFDYSLAAATTVRAGGPADGLFCVSSYEELLKLLEIVGRYKVPWFVLGKGSNLLVHDKGFAGAAIRLKGVFSEIVARGSDEIVVGAGATDSKLAAFAGKRGLSGTEFLAGIPGTIGGAVYMNAGAYGQQMKDIVEWAEFSDENGETQTLSAEELEFGYRRSRFAGKKNIILKAGLKLRSEQPEKIAEREKTMLRARKENQPVDKRTWGSVFINPPGHSAARLIEACGLKGKGAGKARISPKHANFIENTGGATFRDLTETVKMAQKAALDKFGVVLKTEGKIIR